MSWAHEAVTGNKDQVKLVGCHVTELICICDRSLREHVEGSAWLNTLISHGGEFFVQDVLVLLID